jgi:hypothetical protein
MNPCIDGIPKIPQNKIFIMVKAKGITKTKQYICMASIIFFEI